jgi:ABC-type methionine transport system ATPase subunit
MQEIIIAKGLTKIYRSSLGAGEVTALNGVDLSVQSGEFLGIMGLREAERLLCLTFYRALMPPQAAKLLLTGAT